MDAAVLALRVVLALGVVLALLFVLHRKVSTLNGNRAGGQGAVNVVARQGLGAKASLVVLDADGKRFYLGVTEQSVSVLHSSAAPEVVQAASGRITAPGHRTAGDGPAELTASGSRRSGRHASDDRAPAVGTPAVGTPALRALARRVVDASGAFGLRAVRTALRRASEAGVLRRRATAEGDSAVAAAAGMTSAGGDATKGASAVAAAKGASAGVTSVDGTSGIVLPGTVVPETVAPGATARTIDAPGTEAPDTPAPTAPSTEDRAPEQHIAEQRIAEQHVPDGGTEPEVVIETGDADFAAALRRALALPAPVREPAAPSRPTGAEDRVSVPGVESALNGSILSPDTWKQTAAFLRQGRSG